MHYDTVIKGGLLINTHGSYKADLAINGEQIAAIGQALNGRQELDADGLYVLPGAVDGHVHFDNPTFPPYDPPTADDFGTGSAAAAFGGVTTVIDFAQPRPGQSLVEELKRRQSDAQGKTVIDYGLHLNYRDPDPARLAEIPDVFALGVPSFKLYMAYDGYQMPDSIIYQTMEAIAAQNGLAIMHAENFEITQFISARLQTEGKTGSKWHVSTHPSITEGEGIYRSLALAHLAGARILIFHVSCEEGVREIRQARARGQVVYGETCAHYLAYTDMVYDNDNTVTQSLMVIPPIRDAGHQETLWKGLADGVLDIVSTDHCPRPKQEGQARQRPGASEVEVRLAAMHTLGVRTGRISRERWVDTCCTRPAQLFGLEKKGVLIPGYDADIVLFDPTKERVFSPKNLHTPIDFSSYEGFKAIGMPIMTISRGEIVVKDDQLTAPPGRGRFVKRVSS